MDQEPIFIEYRRALASGKPVPPELLLAVGKRRVELLPNDAQALSSLVGIMRSQDTEPPNDLIDRSLRAEFVAATDVDQRSNFARHLVVRLVQSGQHTPNDIVQAALNPATERQIHVFVRGLSNTAPDHRELVRCLLEKAREAWPTSPMALFFLAREMLEADQHADAADLLETDLDLTKKSQHTAELYMRCLSWLGRRAEVSGFLNDFITVFDGDLWCSEGFSDSQRDAINRKIPTLILVTQPKSGTVFTQTTLMRGLRIPQYTMEPKYVLTSEANPMGQRCAVLARGGAICTQHLMPTPEAIDTLRAHGLTKIVVNLRDVRQAAISWVHHSVSDEIQSMPRAEMLLLRERMKQPDEFERHYLANLQRWAEFQQKWLTLIKSPPEGFEFLFTEYDQLRDNERNFFGRIIDFYGIDHQAFDWSVLTSDKKERAGHFRRGEKREWESVLSAETRRQIPTVLSQYKDVEAWLDRKDSEYAALSAT